MTRVRLAAAGICCSLFALSLVGFNRSLPERVEATFPGPLSTPYIHLSPSPDSSPAGSALVIHGLNSNKEFMQFLSMTLADGGFETWAIDLPGHGDSSARFNSEASQRAIESALAFLPARTIVIGHSLGAALVADLSASRHFETAILLSPPPIPLVRLDIDRLLLVSGRFDAPRIDASIPAFVDAASGEAEWQRLPWAAHSTALFNPAHLRMIVEWAGGSGVGLRTAERFMWLALMLVAVLVIPAVGLRLHQQNSTRAFPPERGRMESWPPGDIVIWIGSLATGIAILSLFNPVAWLGIFRTDYLVGVILIAGLIMWRGRGMGMSLRGMLGGSLAGAYVIVAITVVGASVMHLVPSGEQWLRFPLLAAAGFPLFIHDEQTIRMYRPWWRMWGAFLMTRLLVWAAVMTGVLLFSREAAFLVLISHLVVLAWLPLWWLAGMVHRATGEPGAGALFSALVQGWVFATLFVTI